MNIDLRKELTDKIDSCYKSLDITDSILDLIEPLIDYEYQELRNYSESMKAQSEEYELEVRRLRELLDKAINLYPDIEKLEQEK
jgi:hypothetical protein